MTSGLNKYQNINAAKFTSERGPERRRKKDTIQIDGGRVRRMRRMDCVCAVQTEGWGGG